MNSKMLTLGGAVILIIGLFLPVVSALGMSVNMIMPPGEGVSGAGLVVVACAVLGGALALINQTKWAVVPALAALAFLVWKYMQLQNLISSGLGDVPPEAAEAMANMMPSINILGWAVMGIGALVMLVGGAMAWKSTAPPSAA
ncbi:MAG TPA: hypothetical protein VEC11_06310 [Allosphingosinicella sp.]|nr:hypothetical protein [Allosphingosinicella sp.]